MLVVPEGLDIAVMYSAALEDLGVTDVFLLDDACELLEEGLYLGVSGMVVGGGLTLVTAVVLLLDETGDLVEFVEDAALVDPLLLEEDALHEVDQLEDVSGEGVDAGDLELREDLLEAGQQGQLTLVLDVEQVEKVVLLLGDCHCLAALQHQAAVLSNYVLNLVR